MSKTTASLTFCCIAALIVVTGCPAPETRSADPMAGKDDITLQQNGTGCCIMVRKYEDLNANGCLDPEDPELEWQIFWDDPSGVITEGLTPQWCLNAEMPGLWTIGEYTYPDWYVTDTMINWVSQGPTPIVQIEVPDLCDVPWYEVIFLNARVVPPPECNLIVRKINDLNFNGLVDPGEPEIGVIDFNGGGWPITITDPNGLQYLEETRVCMNADLAGTWIIDEGDVEGWWPTGVIVNSSPATAPVELLFLDPCVDNYEVIFLNGTCPQPEPAEICGVKLYYGSDEPIEGFLLCLTGTDINGNEVGPICQYTNEWGYTCWSDLVPGEYQVCEILPDGDWVPVTPECVDTPVGPGEYAPAFFWNYCETTVQMHTKGWWQSPNGCNAIGENPDLLDQLNALAPFMSGAIYCTGRDNCTRARCGTVTLPFDSAAELGCFIVAPNSQNNTLGLRQQLAAFVLNCLNETGSLGIYFDTVDMTAQQIVDGAIEAWQTGLNVKTWQCILDMLNNLECFTTNSSIPCEVLYPDN